MTDSRVTMRDVAIAAGVSTATVSRVINGAGTVDEALVERVKAAIDQTRYIPNAAGRSLRRGGSSLIAVVIPDAENPYFTQLAMEIERVARDAGFGVIVCHTENSLDLEQQYLDSLVSRQVDGVIIAPVDSRQSRIERLKESECPVVLLDRRIHGVVADFVSSHNVAAGELAAEHLSSSGFTRPLVLTGDVDLHTTEDRTDGFVDYFSSVGVTMDSTRVLRGDLSSRESGYVLTKAALLQSDIDCVYATTNKLSVGAFRAIQESAHPVALLATDDDLWTSLVDPSVSVIQQPVRATGRSAARLLRERMVAPHEPPRTVLLHPQLIQRDSTAPHPSQDR